MRSLLALLALSVIPLGAQGLFSLKPLESSGYGIGVGGNGSAPHGIYLFAVYAKAIKANTYSYTSVHDKNGQVSVLSGVKEAVARVGACTVFVGGAAGTSVTSANLGSAFGGDGDLLCKARSVHGGTLYPGFGVAVLKTNTGRGGISLAARFEMVWGK